MDVWSALVVLALGAGMLVLGVQYWRGAWGWLRRPLPWHRAGVWGMTIPLGAAFVFAGLGALVTLPLAGQVALGLATALLLLLAVVGNLLAHLGRPLVRPPWERALLADRAVRERRRAALAGAWYGIDVVRGQRARPVEETFLTRELAEARARDELAAGPVDYVEVVDLRHGVTVAIVEPAAP